MTSLAVLVVSLLIGAFAQTSPTPVPDWQTFQLGNLQGMVIEFEEGSTPEECEVAIVPATSTMSFDTILFENQTSDTVLVQLEHENVVDIQASIAAEGSLEINAAVGFDEVLRFACERVPE